MIVTCHYGCGIRFDDEFRDTICPHQTFSANDGKNNFRHYPESFISFQPPAVAENTPAVLSSVSYGDDYDMQSFLRENGLTQEDVQTASFAHFAVVVTASIAMDFGKSLKSVVALPEPGIVISKG